MHVQVEMFGVTADETGDESAQLLDEFVSLQKEMFSALGLHYRSPCSYTQIQFNMIFIYLYIILYSVCVYVCVCVYLYIILIIYIYIY